MLKAKLCLVFATALLIVGLCSQVQAHSGYEVVAVLGKTPTIDGTISAGEWNDARTVTWLDINNFTCRAYVKQDGHNLYVAFDIPDTSCSPLAFCDDNTQVMLDVHHDGGEELQADDLLLGIYRCPGTYTWRNDDEWITVERPSIFGNGSGWTGATSNQTQEGLGFQTEYSISYSAIGVTAGVAKTLGVGFASVDVTFDVEIMAGWPPIVENNFWGGLVYRPGGPDTWGDLTSGAPFFWIPEPSPLVATALMIAVFTGIYLKKQNIRRQNSCLNREAGSNSLRFAQSLRTRSIFRKKRHVPVVHSR